jgi:hypothetical protein
MEQAEQPHRNSNDVHDYAEKSETSVPPPTAYKAVNLELRFEVPISLDVTALEDAKYCRRDARVKRVRHQK